MQRDDWDQAVSLERGEHLVIVGDGVGIDASRLGLEAAPFQGQPVGVVGVGGGQGEILVEALVMPARIAAPVAASDGARLLLEPPPIVEAVAALHLMGGGGGSPQEAAREWVDGGVHGDGVSLGPLTLGSLSCAVMGSVAVAIGRGWE